MNIFTFTLLLSLSSGYSCRVFCPWKRSRTYYCGSDGVTYNTYCDIQVAIANNPYLSVAYKGVCEHDNISTTSEEYQVVEEVTEPQVVEEVTEPQVVEEVTEPQVIENTEVPFTESKEEWYDVTTVKDEPSIEVNRIKKDEKRRPAKRPKKPAPKKRKPKAKPKKEINEEKIKEEEIKDKKNKEEKKNEEEIKDKENKEKQKKEEEVKAEEKEHKQEAEDSSEHVIDIQNQALNENTITIGSGGKKKTITINNAVENKNVINIQKRRQSANPENEDAIIPSLRNNVAVHRRIFF